MWRVGVKVDLDVFGMAHTKDGGLRTLDTEGKEGERGGECLRLWMTDGRLDMRSWIEERTA